MRLALLLLVACATTSRFTPPSWPDSEAVRAAILCAAEREHGADVAQRLASIQVQARPGFPFRGLYYGGRISLEADEPSASASAWRHEAVHALLHLTTGDAHGSHDETFLAAERRFNAAFRECRLNTEERLLKQP